MQKINSEPNAGAAVPLTFLAWGVGTESGTSL